MTAPCDVPMTVAVSELVTVTATLEWRIEDWKDTRRCLSLDDGLEGPEFRPQQIPGVRLGLSLEFEPDKRNHRGLRLMITLHECKTPARKLVLRGSFSVPMLNKRQSFDLTMLTSECLIGPQLSNTEVIGDALTVIAQLTVVARRPELRYIQTEPHESARPGDRCLQPYSQPVSDLLRDLEDLGGAFHDLIIRVDDETFPCHRAVLAARSPVLKDILEQQMHEKGAIEIPLDDTNPKAWRHFLQFIYTARTSLRQAEPELVAQVLGLGDKYRVTSLVAEAAEALQETVCRSNVVDVLWLASRYQLSGLLDKACAVFGEHAAHLWLQRGNEIELLVDSKPELAERLLNSLSRRGDSSATIANDLNVI